MTDSTPTIQGLRDRLTGLLADWGAELAVILKELEEKRARVAELEAKAGRNGEDLVTDATVNRIHLLGAVRAARQCLDCHNVERGALLGAFSYELRRTPPLVVEKAS